MRSSFLSLVTALAVIQPALSASDPNSPDRYATCEQKIVPVTVSADNYVLPYKTPRNQSEITGIVAHFWAQNSNSSKAVFASEKKTIMGTYNIWTQLCIPHGWNKNGNGTVDIAIHGINFDHTYWQFGYSPEYNFVQAATKNGHAVFTYDRLGIGYSDHPDGIQVVQTATEIEIANYLIEYVKKDTRFTKSKFVGIGHSYGSVTMLALATQFPRLLSHIIVTGFSISKPAVGLTFSSWMSTIAHTLPIDRFKRYKNDTSYFAIQADTNDEYWSYNFPYYAPEAFKLAVDTRSTYTLGEFVTIDATWSTPAPEWTGKLLVVTGEKDILFCGGDCYQKPILVNGTDLLDDLKSLFPAASTFSKYMPPNTGHAINIHYTAAETFKHMLSWIDGRYV